MKRIAELIKSMGLPFAYDHFAEGESPAPPFICYLTPGSETSLQTAERITRSIL